VYKLMGEVNMNCKGKAGNTVELGFHVVGRCVFFGYVHFLCCV
jgi:hypothetical protein